MTTTPYKPREGSMAARLIAHLQEHGGSMGRKQIAELLGIPPNNVPPNMAAAVHHGALVRDGGTYALPLGTATQPAADLQQAWGGAGKPAFPSAPPRVGGPLPDAAASAIKAEPRKMRTLKDVTKQFHREQKAVSNSRSVVVAIKQPPAPTTALAVPSNEPASLRQIGGTHYKQMAVQPWDVVDDWPLEQRVGYYRGNALKYLMRMGSKDQDAQEIGKGRHYIEKLLEVLQEQDVQVPAA
jgi:hypothetical protein